MEIPEGWNELLLQDITAKTISYGIVQAGPHVDDGIPYIKSSDLTPQINLEELQRTSHAIHKKYVRSSVVAGDIVFSLRGDIGAVAIVPPTIKVANLTQGTARIAANESVNTNFLYQLFKSNILKKAVLRVCKGSTFQEISLKDLRKIKVTLPDTAAQNRIAEILGTWDQAIAVTEALIAQSEAQKKALMQQLLTGKRRRPGFKGEWKEVRLGDVVSLWKGKQKGRAELTNDGPVPVINGGISASGYTEESNAPADTITISEGGNSCGYVALQDEAFWCGGHCYALLKPNMDISFLFAQLKYSQRQIMRLRVGSGLPNIQKKDLTQLKLLQPSMKEQKAIGELFNSCDIGLSQLQAKLQTLKTEKAALMQQLLTGKRRVKLTEAA